MSDTHLGPVFDPGSVAVIGARRGAGPGSFNVVENLLEFGFEGAVYPVNPKADEVVGLEAYDSVTDIDEPIDHAIIFLPRHIVPEALEGCGQQGIPAVTIVSQGFADAGPEGAEVQDELVDIANRYDIALIGPNTMGIHNYVDDFTTAFAPMARREYDPIAVVAQTGLFSMSFPDLTYGKFIDLGNASHVDHVDVLEYLADDPDTEQVFLHIEGLQPGRGRDLVEVARDAVTSGTDVIAFKTGASDLGKTKAESHTGSLVSDAAVAEGAFSQGNIQQVRDYTELQVVSKALHELPEMDGDRVAMITHHGGAGIMAIDAIEEYGLTLADISPETVETIEEMSPPWLDIGNPIDIGPATLGDAPTAHRVAIEAPLQDDAIDALVLSLHIADPTPWPYGFWGHIDAIEDLAPEYDKPIVVVPVGTDQSETRRRLAAVENAMAVDDIRQAIRAFAAVDGVSAARRGER